MTENTTPPANQQPVAGLFERELGAWVPVAQRLPEPGAAVLVARGKCAPGIPADAASD